MLPLWLMIAKGVKNVADNQNNQIDNFNKNQQYTANGQPGDSDNGLGNAFSTFSSIYGNYLDSSILDNEKKKKLFQQ